MSSLSGLVLRANSVNETVPAGSTNYIIRGLQNGQNELAVVTNPNGYYCIFEVGNLSTRTLNIVNMDITGVNISCQALGNVVSVYPVNGANWNDYINYPTLPVLTNGRETPFAQADAPCTPVPRYRGCIHGAELKNFRLLGESSCAEITAYDYDSSDNLVNALNWVCRQDSSGNLLISSTGLRDSKGLRDLINMTAFTWKNLKLKVFKNKTAFMETNPATWWSNTITNSVGACPTASPLAGLIYIIGNNSCSTAVTLTNNKISILSQVGTNVQYTNVGISFTGGNFNWIEINYSSNATPTNAFSFPSGSFFNQVRNSRFSFLGSAAVILINGGVNNTIHGNFFSGNPGFTIAIANTATQSRSNVVTNNRIINSSATGSALNFVSFFRFGIIMGNTMGSLGSTSVNPVNAGVNNFFANNFIFGTNIGNGVSLATATQGNDTFVNTNIINIANSGNALDIATGTNASTISGFAANLLGTSNSIRIQSGTVQNNFYGRMIVPANSCNILSSNLTNVTCAPISPSDNVISSPTPPFNNEFAGIVSGDSRNTTSGASSNSIITASSITDWYNFENNMRAYLPSAVFPTAGFNTCLGGSNCQIIDLSLKSGSSIFRNVNSCPNGNSVITGGYYETAQGGSNTNCANNMMRGFFTTSADSCDYTSLRNAVELLNDGVGNDNGHCESNETCLFTPNIHSYQGHHDPTDIFGDYIPASTPTPTTLTCPDIGTGGTIQNVKLVKFAVNGR